LPNILITLIILIWLVILIWIHKIGKYIIKYWIKINIH